MSCLIVQVRDMLRVEYVPRCNAICAGFVFKIKRQFQLFCFGLGLASLNCLEISFNKIVKPLTAR